MIFRVVELDLAEACREADVVGDDYAGVQALEVDDDHGVHVELAVRLDDQRDDFQLVLVLYLVYTGAEEEMIGGF